MASHTYPSLQTSLNIELISAYLWTSGGRITGGTTEDDITGDKLGVDGSTVKTVVLKGADESVGSAVVKVVGKWMELNVGSAVTGVVKGTVGVGGTER